MSIASVTPITLHRDPMDQTDAYALAPGFFVLNENVMRGDVPRGDVGLMQVYKKLEALTRKAYYAAVKHCVPTPFGYWVPEQGLAALKDEVAELQEEASSLNILVGGDFEGIINFLYVRSNPDDPLMRRRIAAFLIDRLEGVKQKLLELNPETDKKALIYTQDPTKRLHLCVRGRFRDIVERACISAREIAHEIKVFPSTQQNIDFSKIDLAIEMLRRVEEKLSNEVGS